MAAIVAIARKKEAQRNDMAVKITYVGGMCVLIERSDGYKILFDPYLTKNKDTNKPTTHKDNRNSVRSKAKPERLPVW